MKASTKRFICTTIFGGCVGFVLGIFKIHINTWPFWAIAIPLAFASILLLDMIFPDEPEDENEG